MEHFMDNTQPHVTNDQDTMLRLIAFIFNIITTVTTAWLIIPLAWMIPMTVISYGIYKGTKQNTVTFAVCTLIFVNLVSGVLLLISKKDA
jgi:ABC-type methionine transport system permease subunit